MVVTDVHHADGAREAAIGFSLYVDGLVDLGLGQESKTRVLLPLESGADARAERARDALALYVRRIVREIGEKGPAGKE